MIVLYPKRTFLQGVSVQRDSHATRYKVVNKIGASRKDADTDSKAKIKKNSGGRVNPLIQGCEDDKLLDYDTCDEPPDELSQFKGLVLDLSYRPINIVSWKRALCLEILEKMSEFVYTPKPKKVRVSLTRTNIFIRDKFKCQYCNGREELTIDHILPVSKGGTATWDNLVTACTVCNLKKGSLTLENSGMKLNKLPGAPNVVDNRELPPNYTVFRKLINSKLPSEWVEYLPQRSLKPVSKLFRMDESV